MKHFLLLVLLFFPTLAFAQADIMVVVGNFTIFLGGVIIPFIFGLAFLFFVWNAVRYFIIDSANEQARAQARSLALYGIMAFVIVVIFWGIVEILSVSIGLDGETAPQPDFIDAYST